TIRIALKQKKMLGYETLLLSPGNYGQHFALEAWGLDLDTGVKCSNFIGETLDIASELGFSQILLIGHIGKLIKVAAGVMNTHSGMADARLETLSACALLAGVDADTARGILNCTTTDDALQILTDNHILDAAMKIALEKMLAHMRRRAGEGIQIEIILFSNMHGVLAMSDNAQAFITQISLKGAL
ncbi:MAG: cobalt-precorrin-5B (C(1))-methyltransferase, partial [Lachnospiraceae bacterium]|nr:cobalt-precorrin-5B (C(1))-methyltransferase [Lachnospiraceae bacterium]